MLLFEDARVGCFSCDRTLDDETGTSVCWSIGCDQPGCSRWACFACAGFPSQEVGEQFEGDWFCKAHRPSTVASLDGSSGAGDVPAVPAVVSVDAPAVSTVGSVDSSTLPTAGSVDANALPAVRSVDVPAVLAVDCAEEASEQAGMPPLVPHTTARCDDGERAA